jgi:hypothetical protein
VENLETINPSAKRDKRFWFFSGKEQIFQINDPYPLALIVFRPQERSRRNQKSGRGTLLEKTLISREN